MPALGKAQKGYSYKVLFKKINTDLAKFITTLYKFLMYCGNVSFFCILILQSLSLSDNFLWSLFFSNNSINSFHIANEVYFPWIFEEIWSQSPSNIILLTLATSFFHWARLWALYAWGFSTSILMYSSNPLSSNTASMRMFHATNFEEPSNAYSSLSPLKAILSILKKTYNIDL